MAQAQVFGPLLDQLQARMEPFARQRVLFDLKLCKMSQFAFKEIADGKADFQRLGAVSYLRAKQLNPSVQAMVQETAGKKASILVRTVSPITNLSQFDGKSFAFGDTISTIAALAKVALVRAGVRATNLSFCLTVDENVRTETDPDHPPRNPNAGATNLPVLISGWEAVQGVGSGQFHGTALQDLYLQRRGYKGKGLRAVHTFEVTPNVYVAHITNDQARSFATAFRRAMLAINDTQLLHSLPIVQQPLDRFQEVSEIDFNQLQSYLTNEVAEFERVSAQPPKRKE